MAWPKVTRLSLTLRKFLVIVLVASCSLMVTRILIASYTPNKGAEVVGLKRIHDLELSQKQESEKKLVKLQRNVLHSFKFQNSQSHQPNELLENRLQRDEHREHGHYIVDGVVEESLNENLHKNHGAIALSKTPNNGSSRCLEWVKRAPKPPYFLTAVLLVRIYVTDKAKLTTKEMKEWLLYLRYAGVQHVYIYDAWVLEDESQLSTLKAYEDDGYITYIDWHTHNPYTISGTQVAAYQHCIDKFASENTWQAAIDIDEYPFSPRDTAPGFLYRYVKDFSDFHPQVSEITMQNYLYLGKPLEKELMIERLFRRTHGPANPLVKPIYKASHVRAQVHHNGLLKGRSMNAPSVELRMNHYWGARLQNWGEDTPEILEKTEPDYDIQPIISAFKECEFYVRPYLEDP